MALFLPTAATVARIAPIAVLANTAVLTTVAAQKPTLTELLAGAPTPWTLSALATWLDVAPLLLERVAARRQPLPRALVARMAEAAGLQGGEVEAVVDVVAVETPIAYRPTPSDRAMGDRLDFAPLAKTVESYA